MGTEYVAEARVEHLDLSVMLFDEGLLQFRLNLAELGTVLDHFLFFPRVRLVCVLRRR